MIARTWRGWTSHEDAQAPGADIQPTGHAEYVATPGNRGAHRDLGVDHWEVVAPSDDPSAA